MTIRLFSSKIGEKNLLPSNLSENNFTDFESVLRLIFLVFVTVFVNCKTFAQTQLISANDGGFESGTKTFAANGWTVVNDNTNKWYVGTATKGAGTNGAYIDNNSGATNNYTITTNNTSHFYRDIIIPAGATNITLSFLLKGSGQINLDRLLIYTAPTTVTPVAGTPVQGTTTFSGATLQYNQSSFYSSYTSQSVVLPNSLAGTTVRLIFTWQNDNNTGTNPPAAVDNISLVYTPCAVPTLTFTTTPTCVGGSTGTITATGSGGTTPYSYSMDGVAYQSGNTFSGLAAGNYTLYINSASGCGTSTSVTISPYANSTDPQTAAGNDSWIGYAYQGMNFNNYIGYFTEPETFNEGFGGNTTCFPVTSNSGSSSLFTEQFSVTFRMNSSSKGLYIVDLGSDDGSRLYVDGTLVYNNWVDQSFTTKSKVLMSLTGSSSLQYDYYENAVSNQVVFLNFIQVLANNLSTNTSQTICLGSTGSAISGDIYATLPSGISKSGTGYQWTYSTTPAGSRTNISGATGATYTPSTSTTPFNATGTYYIYRNAIVSSTNNVSPSPYVATNESNAATIIVSAVSTPTASVTSQPTCAVSTGTITVSAPTGAGITYSNDGTNYFSSATFSNVATGSYNVTAKNSNGCFSSATNVIVNAQPAGPVAPTAGVTTQPTCATSTGTITITAPTGAGISYSIDGVTYSNTTGIFAGVATGIYNITDKNSSGCISASTSVTVNAQPLPIGNNQLDYTNGAHGTLCATPAENGTATLVAAAGTVFTTVTFASYGTPNGSCNSFTINSSCNAASSQSIVEGYLLGNGGTVSIPANNGIFTDPCVGTVKKLYVQATYTQPICAGTSPGTITGSVPTGGNGAFTYYWEQSTTSSSTGFGPASGTNNTINYTPGNLTQTTWYRRTVTSGCTSVSAVIQVTVNALPATPTISAGGSTTFCTGGSVTLTSSAGTSYLWSTGATTQSISTTTSGSYSVKVTNASGCQSISSSATVVTVNALPTTPTISAGGSTTFCAGGSVTLTSSAGSSYLWSTGATTQSISSTASGNYTVQVTNASGCQSASSSATVVTVNALPATPTISAGGSTTFCAGGSVTLTSSAGTSYLWSTGATTQSISATTSGSYSVKVNNASGCQSISSSATVVTVNALPTTPTISAGGSTTFCAGGSVTLTSSAGSSYLWSTGATTQSISATTSGNYTVQVTNASGCQSASSSATAVTVNALPATPTISAGGSTTFCAGGSVTLTSSAGTSYLWSTGATTQSISATTSGSYSVKVTNASGCQSASSSATVVTVNALPATPTISAGGSTTFCAGGSVTLTSSAGTSYLWSTGATTQSISATASGNYTVQVTNASGCQSASSSGTVVTVNALPATPTISAGGSTTFCAGGSVTLTSSAGTSYLWSTGATTQSISATASGNYTVQVTNANGCQSASSSATAVTVNALPATPTISAGGSTTFCAGGSVTLTSSAGTSYLWSTGATTQSISATTSGSYSVKVTNASGCQSASSSATVVTVNALPATPTISAGGSTTFCAGGSVTLTSSAGSSYFWSTGATTQSISATASGSYTVQVTNASGCQSASSSATVVTVNALPATPTISAGSSTTFCAGGSVTLTSSAGSSYLWSTGATTQSISATTSGSYSVKVTNASGCQSISSSATVVTVNALPTTPTISAGGSTTFCAGGSVTLTSSAGTSYLWSTGATTQSISATTSGSYTVQIANASGCQSASSLATSITVTTMPSATISYSGTPYCSSAGFATVSLTGNTGGSFTSDANLVIDASTGTINLATSTAGSHTITYKIAASGGCSQFSTSTTITITTQPYATGFYPNTPYCSNIGTLVPTGSYNGLLGTLSASPSGLSINSSTGVINVSASTPGSYTVYYNVPANGGCSAYSANAPLVISTAPSATINYVAGPYCFGAGTATVTQTGTTGGVYSSTAGLIIDASSGAINLNTSLPNTYTVSYTIAASNGCSQYVQSCSITINAKVSSLAFTAGSNSARCQGAGTVTYGATASNSTGIAYSLDATSLSAGNTINSTTGAVTYVAGWSGTSVITAIANGCTPLTATHSATTNATPSVSAATTLTCVGGSTGTITATGAGGSSPYTFNLNSGSYQSGTLFGNLAVGTYTLGIKSAAGCTSSTSVIVSTYPTSADDQTASATNTWIGHTYSGNNFQNYIGHFTEPETFNESFGGSTTCFGLTSGATYPSIYTDNFSVRFRMKSSRQGLYVVDLGSDDGSRLYIDGTLIYNNWTPQSFSTRAAVLMSLNGNNALTYEYFENTGSNQVIFQNLTLVLANSLSTNTTQNICFGNAGSIISGDVYGALPSGISLSGTGYQWSYSLTPTGSRTNITGATGAAFTPNSSTAPFNTPGTYYVYRNALLSSGNNTGINPYVASNESNAAVITVTAVPSATISYINTPFCNSSSLPESVTLNGTAGGSFSSPGLTMNASNGAITPNQNSVGFYTITYTIPATGGCSSFSTTTPVYIGTPGTWSGKIDTSWDNAGNWICGQIPSSTIDATIPKMVANFPTVLSNTSEAKDVNIQSGASLVVIGTIKIAGNINNSGNFNVSNGTIEMEGSNAQSLAGSMFENKTIKNLVINNTGSGVSVSSTANDTLKLTGFLSFGNASAVLNTGDNITLVSNSAGTAAVGVVGAANSINGNVIVERFINTGTAAGEHAKSWQFLATPTTGQTIKQSWMENGTAANYYGTMISGPSGTSAGFDISSPAASMKYYNYATYGWTGVANTGNAIANNKGYMVFVRGDRTVTGATQAANPTVLRTKGTLNTGSLASIIVHNNKYESIGNPYAAPIDFTLLSKDAAIDDKYYTWDPYLYGSYGTGGYQTITAVNNWQPVPGGTVAYPSSVSNSIIQSGQAFFVHATSADSTGTSNVNFMENCKSITNGSNKFSRMEGTIVNTKRQFLRASLLTNAGLMADGNVVAFDKTFSSGIDGNDALKMLNSGENFTVKAGGQLLAVDATSPVGLGDTIYYYTSNLAKTTYKLIFAPENMQSAGVQAFLVDKFLSTETPVSLTDSTFINVTVTTTAASFASDRFKIVFRQLAALPVTITAVTATLKNKDVEVNWNVQNESGIQQYQVERSSDGTNFNQVSSVTAKNSVTGSYSWTDLNVADGTYYYRIKIITVDGKTSYTQIVKVISGKLQDQISVFPNPVQSGIIHLQLTNQPEGNYGVRLFNSAGQLIVSKKITHAKGTSEETIICPNLAKGIYQLEIIKTDGSVEVIKVMN